MSDQDSKKKKKVGRKPMMGEAMTPAQKMQKKREKVRKLILTGNPALWDEQICAEAMSNKKYAEHKEKAWKRYGELNGFN